MTRSSQCPGEDEQQKVSDYQSILTELSQSNTKSLNIKVSKRQTILILLNYQYLQAERF